MTFTASKSPCLYAVDRQQIDNLFQHCICSSQSEHKQDQNKCAQTWAASSWGEVRRDCEVSGLRSMSWLTLCAPGRGESVTHGQSSAAHLAYYHPSESSAARQHRWGSSCQSSYCFLNPPACLVWAIASLPPRLSLSLSLFSFISLVPSAPTLPAHMPSSHVCFHHILL